MAGRRLIQLAVWQIKRCLWTEEHAATILYHFHNRMSDMVRLQKRASRSSARKIEADKQHSGIGSTLWQVILGRVVSGIGGAGMTALVSILITGMRLRQVAAWRSYVNVAATTGRSLGGPVGGFLADTIGWRWFVRLQLVDSQTD
jgi:hypothetical protein